MNSLRHKNARVFQVRNDDLDSIPVIIPSNEVLQKYSKIVGPYFIKMNQIMQENQQLSKYCQVF